MHRNTRECQFTVGIWLSTPSVDGWMLSHIMSPRLRSWKQNKNRKQTIPSVGILKVRIKVFWNLKVKQILPLQGSIICAKNLTPRWPFTRECKLAHNSLANTINLNCSHFWKPVVVFNDNLSPFLYVWANWLRSAGEFVVSELTVVHLTRSKRKSGRIKSNKNWVSGASSQAATELRKYNKSFYQIVCTD